MVSKRVRFEDEVVKKDDTTREDFCGACLAVPAALSGSALAGYGATAKKGKHKKTKKIVMWVGVGVTLLSVIIAVVYLKTCKKCR